MLCSTTLFQVAINDRADSTMKPSEVDVAIHLILSRTLPPHPTRRCKIANMHDVMLTALIRTCT